MPLDDLVRLRRARDRMDREYAQPLDVPALARTALMSSGHFSRSFRAAYGETPYNYLMTRRIERAKALLRRGDLSVTEVCMAVGCTSLGSFSTRFTELVGQSPSAYRAGDHEPGAAIPACIAKIHTRPVRRAEPKETKEAKGGVGAKEASGAKGATGEEDGGPGAPVA
ncbi:helix-turn-helix transcriptional regulator [Kitasatospora sp. NPDC005856]|uniref:helix-turn-helix transcriptional regulator n=1 Tax=Kitasatospora sp. NPDC005856 TaxID=3154566 RepID=UPI0033FCACBF